MVALLKPTDAFAQTNRWFHGGGPPPHAHTRNQLLVWVKQPLGLANQLLVQSRCWFKAVVGFSMFPML